MNIIDIRNYLTHRKIRVLEVNPDTMYFTEIRMDDGRLFLFLIEYDLESKQERILINYSVDDARYLPRCHMFGRTILVVYENGRDAFWVYKVDKKTGEEFYSGQFNCVGDFDSCFMLDEDRILVYTVPNAETAHLFSAYKEATGSGRIVYLYSLEEEERQLIKNEILSRADSEQLYTYYHGGNTHLLIADSSGTDREKEAFFENSERQWHSLKTHSDAIWIIPCAELFLSIEKGEMEYPYTQVISVGTEGWARYMGMDSTSIYYRYKDFKTGLETLYSHDKLNDEKQAAETIDWSEQGGNVRLAYHTKNAKAYKITDDEYAFTIEGAMRSRLKAARIEKKLGEYFGCIEDRYVVCSFGLGEEEEQEQEVYEYKYTSLYDVRTDYNECVQGSCTIIDSNLILY